MQPNEFRVSLTKEQLTFSAAHFITFGENLCERLHGHNYGVRCEVYGGVNQHGYVADFIALRDALSGIVSQLDHRVLLPTDHASINVKLEGDEVLATFEIVVGSSRKRTARFCQSPTPLPS